MPQLFSADAQANGDSVAITAAGSAAIVSTNPLQPPYQTAKAKIHASWYFLPDADETGCSASIIRNPNSEAVQVALLEFSFTAGTQQLLFTLDGVDEIPDPRAVSYQLVVNAITNTGDDEVAPGAYIEATLISG